MKTILFTTFFILTSYHLTCLTLKASIEECPICMDASVELSLECNHTLCKSCYDTILEEIGTCPMCRANLHGQKKPSDISISTKEDLKTKLEYTSREKLFSYIRNGRFKKVKKILSDKNHSITDQHGNTPLHVAAQNNQQKTAKLLVGLGADLNAQNKTGQTALHYCFAYNHFKLAEKLILLGASDIILNNYSKDCYDGLK